MMLVKILGLEDLDKPIETKSIEEGGGLEDEGVKKLVIFMYSL